MSKKQITVKVTSFDNELTFTIDNKTKGNVLFQQVIHTFGLRETWYFGLQFTISSEQKQWLDLDKKIIGQGISLQDNKLNIEFLFKYFPENIEEEIIQESTLRFLYLQMKNDILNQSLYCPADKAVLLASFALQIKYNNYDEVNHIPGYFINDKLLPPGIMTSHSLSLEEWESKVINLYKEHSGLHKEDAMLEYLKIIQNLEMYGITYFAITNKKGTSMYLGVDALSINIYDINDKLSPRISFPWSEIKNVSYSSNKFKIRLNEKKNNFSGRTKDKISSKSIYDIATGNHDLYALRRQPDSLEIQQMKVQRTERKKTREMEGEKLKREMELSKEAQEMRKEIQILYDKAVRELWNKEEELIEAKKNINHVTSLYEETYRSREALSTELTQLKDLIDKLTKAKFNEEQEKLNCLKDIEAKQILIDNMRESILEKEEQRILLVESFKETQKKMMEETEKERNHQTEKEEIEEDKKDENKEIVLLEHEPAENKEIDAPLDNLMIELKEKLKRTVKENETSYEDKIYKEILKTGRNKYETLKDVRRGNTKRRIDVFEMM